MGVCSISIIVKRLESTHSIFCTIRATKAGQILPFSSFDSDNPEKLWGFLAEYEKRTGGEVFAVPHNANLSNGMMFQTTDFSGKSIDQRYAETRIRWKPLVEVTQIKDEGEAHPKLSPEDRFADFENWDKGNVTATTAKEDWMLQHEYARSALKIRLQIEYDTGVNPYKFGMIGSTDAHTGLATAREDNFWGKFSIYEPGIHRLTHFPIVKGKLGKSYDLHAYEIVASGYAAVWARENTREALFAAMKRKEVYATTGPRIRVQTFAAWDFTEADSLAKEFSDIGYEKGVPMGGSLAMAPAGKSPTFILKALKDPDGVNLERIQVVKGWLDENGKSHEKIYDVAISNKGTIDLVTFWRDPEFEPGLRSFYYIRVLEIPKDRWTTVDAIRFNVELNREIPEKIQDRAYTSPNWYSP